MTPGAVMQTKIPVSLERETKRVDKAVMQFVFNEPFYAFLIMRLRRTPSSEYPALATDGVTLWWNPAYTSEISDAEIQGALAHIVMHCANGHPWRGLGRDNEVWNESCDLAINPILEESRFALPDDHQIQDRFRGKSAESVYMVMLEEKIEPPPSGGGGSGQGGGGQGQSAGQGNGQGQGSSGSGSSAGSGQGCGQVVSPSNVSASVNVRTLSGTSCKNRARRDASLIFAARSKSRMPKFTPRS